MKGRKKKHGSRVFQNHPFCDITHFLFHMLLSPILFLESLAWLIAIQIYLFPPSTRPTLGAGSFPICPSVDKPVPGPIPDGSQAVLAYHALAWPKTPTRRRSGRRRRRRRKKSRWGAAGHASARQDEQRTSSSSKQVRVDLCTS